ncbi:MAG: hypothetical protein IPH95_14190 [Candidatus Promineofilum sp.]|nr:hypothetical protein [Promineifilum sp.]
MATSPHVTRPTGRGRRGLGRRLGRFGKRAFISVLGEDRFLRARAAHHLRRRRRHGQGLLLVHTMGKVGSTTVGASLRQQGIRRTMAMYQPHFLSDEGRAFAEQLATQGVGGWEQLVKKERSDFLRSRLLGQELARMRAEGERVKIITMVRDPVATNVSGLFHNHTWWPAALKAECAAGSPGCLDALSQYFLNSYPHDVPETWFDMELRALYGVDVYAQPFDPRRGYAVYHSDTADVLLLKLETLNQVGAAAVRDFLGLAAFELVPSNTAEDKSYADLYKAFRRQVHLPAAYLDRVYGSRMARHFYAPEELAAFRGKWSAAQ